MFGPTEKASIYTNSDSLRKPTEADGSQRALAESEIGISSDGNSDCAKIMARGIRMPAPSHIHCCMQPRQYTRGRLLVVHGSWRRAAEAKIGISSDGNANFRLISARGLWLQASFLNTLMSAFQYYIRRWLPIAHGSPRGPTEAGGRWAKLAGEKSGYASPRTQI